MNTIESHYDRWCKKAETAGRPTIRGYQGYCRVAPHTGAPATPAAALVVDWQWHRQPSIKTTRLRVIEAVDFYSDAAPPLAA